MPSSKPAVAITRKVMDQMRAAKLVELFQRDGCQALICRAPQQVLMLTGYLPILGNSFCLVSLDVSGEPHIRLAVPIDEEDLVHVQAGGNKVLSSAVPRNLDWLVTH